MSKTVVGQNEAKKVIANTVYMHFVLTMLRAKNIKYNNIRPVTLLTGPSGNGKTFMIKQAVEALRELVQDTSICPLLEIDCTSLTPEGFKGNNLTKILKFHKAQYKKNRFVLDSTIVYLDEFDKICTPFVTSSGEDFHKETQYNLLKAIEGGKILSETANDETEELNTSSYLFIMSGNFPRVRELLDQKKKPSIGFSNHNAHAGDEVTVRQALQESGMATQLAGRLTSIGAVDVLKRHQLEDILRKNIIPEIIDFYRKMDYTLVISNDMVDIVLDKCLTVDSKSGKEKAKTGARALKAELEELLSDNLFETEYKFTVSYGRNEIVE